MAEPGYPVANPVAVLREEFDDWAVLFNPDTADAVGVNPVGVSIWKLMDGRHSVEEIIDALRDGYDAVPETVADEVGTFLANLTERGFVGYEAETGGWMTGTAQAVMRTPRSLDLELTARCNLRCTYCYFFGNEAVEYRDLSTEEWLQFFDECGRLGVMDLSLAGGEPFMRRDLRALLDGIVRNRMRYSLLSNGGLINDEIAAYIAATGRCDFVQVSMDGGTAAPHDIFRGQGSWEGAVRGIRTLQRHGVRVAVRVTLHRHNVDRLEQTAAFLLEELGLPGFSTNTAGYLGNCQQSSHAVLLTNEQRRQAMETLLRLEARYPGRITANAGPLAEAHMWQAMETARSGGAPVPWEGGRLTACGCPSSKIAVRADGTIVPCSMLAHMELGRVNQDSLADVWLHSEGLQSLRTRREIPLTDFAFCAGCEYTAYCTGNCPGLAYTLTGQVKHPSPDACLRRFLAEGGMIPCKRIEAG